jgi:hypothetical protein
VRAGEGAAPLQGLEVYDEMTAAIDQRTRGIVHTRNSARPLVAVVCSVPLLGEAVRDRSLRKFRRGERGHSTPDEIRNVNAGSLVARAGRVE